MYCEQLGANRQLEGSPGEIPSWYSRTRAIAVQVTGACTACHRVSGRGNCVLRYSRHYSVAPKDCLRKREQFALELGEARLVGLAPGPDQEVARTLTGHDPAAPDFQETPPQTIAGHRGGLELRNDQSHP